MVFEEVLFFDGRIVYIERNIFFMVGVFVVFLFFGVLFVRSFVLVFDYLDFLSLLFLLFGVCFFSIFKKIFFFSISDEIEYINVLVVFKLFIDGVISCVLIEFELGKGYCSVCCLYGVCLFIGIFIEVCVY